MPFSKEKRKEFDKLRYKRRVAWMMEYLGGKCSKCPSVEGLEIDHIDPATKSFTVTRKYSAAKEKLIEELDKCQLLCSECHKTKTKSEPKKNAAKGEKISKLSKKEVLEIRSLYEKGNKTHEELAARYNVSRENIGAILRRETWQHL